MVRDTSPHVKQEDTDGSVEPIPDADTYYVVLSRDCPGVYLYRPPKTALGLHLDLLPIVVICRRRSEALNVHKLNTEIIEKLQDPCDPNELRNAIHRSYTARTAFPEAGKTPFYALRIAQQTGIYHGFDWNTQLLPLIADSQGPEFKSHNVFGEALLWMLNKEHLWTKFKVKPTDKRFGEDTAPVCARSAPLLGPGGPGSASIVRHPGSAPPSPVKRGVPLGNATSAGSADRVETLSFPAVGDVGLPGDSASAARTLSRAGSPVKPRATRAASPTKLVIPRSTSPAKITTARAGSPVKQPSGSGLTHGTRPSTPTREFPTVSMPPSGVRGGCDTTSHVVHSSPSRARARAERAWALQQVIDVSDDEGDVQEQPSAPILDHLRTIIRPAGLLTNDLLIFDLGSSMDVWLAARRMPPVTQICILQAFLWSANMTDFIVAAGQPPLELSVRDAEYVWRLLTTWVASK